MADENSPYHTALYYNSTIPRHLELFAWWHTNIYIYIYDAYMRQMSLLEQAMDLLPNT